MNFDKPMSKEEIDKRLVELDVKVDSERQYAWSPDASPSDKAKELINMREVLERKLYQSTKRSDQEKLIQQIVDLSHEILNESTKTALQVSKVHLEKRNNEFIQQAIQRVKNGENKQKVFEEIAAKIDVPSKIGNYSENQFYIEKLSKALQVKIPLTNKEIMARTWDLETHARDEMQKSIDAYRKLHKKEPSSEFSKHRYESDKKVKQSVELIIEHFLFNNTFTDRLCNTYNRDNQEKFLQDIAELYQKNVEEQKKVLRE